MRFEENKEITRNLPDQQADKKKPREFSNIVAERPLQSTQSDVMIYDDRYHIHNYKYVLGPIGVYQFQIRRSKTTHEYALPESPKQFERIV